MLRSGWTNRSRAVQWNSVHARQMVEEPDTADEAVIMEDAKKTRGRHHRGRHVKVVRVGRDNHRRRIIRPIIVTTPVIEWCSPTAVPMLESERRNPGA